MADHRNPMPAGAEGATDVLSSLPIIACCIIAVMVLVAAIGQTSGNGYEGGGGAALDDSCAALLDETLNLLTERSEDGRRYLDADWRGRAVDVPLPESPIEGASYAVTVRLLGERDTECSLSGNISACSEVFSESAPVMLVSGGVCIPGDIIARVGL